MSTKLDENYWMGGVSIMPDTCKTSVPGTISGRQ